MDASTNDKGIFIFGPFRLDASRRTLSRDGDPIKLTSRLFDTLLYLIENSGRLVEKDELLSAIWGGRIVEEGNLTSAISELRKILQIEGETTPMIATAPRRGYRFMAAVRHETSPAPLAGMSIATPLIARRRKIPSLAVIAIAAAAISIAISVWLARPQPVASPPAFAPPANSIAILPFANMSATADRDYIADGLSEELIGALSEINQMHVIARTSSFAFKGSHTGINDIARQLNVSTVLEGSIREQGGRLRITAELIDGLTGFHLWSHIYDRDQGDVLHLQTDIATEVTRALKLTLLGGDLAKLNRGGTNNPGALDAYLRGIALKHQMDPATGKAALAAFDQAIALDPYFAMAHIMRARMLAGMAEGFGDSTADVSAGRALAAQGMAAAELAVRLASDLAPAHSALSDAALDDWDFQRAGAEIGKAMELQPNDSATLIDYAWFQAYTGHPDIAQEAAQRAAVLNPLSANVYVDMVWTQLWARNPLAAAQSLRHAEQLKVGHALDVYLQGRIALAEGNYAAAQQICGAGEDWKQNYCLAIADHGLGQQGAADAQLALLRSRMGNNAAFQYADIYAQWGRPGDALDALENAYRVRDTGMMEIQVDPFLDPVRGTDRFKDIVRRLNFPN